VPAPDSFSLDRRSAGARCARLTAVLLLCFTATVASASAQGLSTLGKRGTDAQSGATATSGGAAGATEAGRTINWVLDYRNTTGASANINITDPITGNQSFVGGSLRTPPGMAPRWSTDGGASYVDSEPGAGVNAVGAAGTSVDASTGAEDLFSPPVQSFTSSGAGGDGFEALFVGDRIFNVHHHRPVGVNMMDCHIKATGARCPGYPLSHVSPNAGDAFGTGPDTLGTASFTSAAVSGNRIYFPAAVQGTTSIGVACADMVAEVSCGYTELGDSTFASAPGSNPVGGGALVGTRYYLLGGAVGAPIHCFDISTGAACAGWTSVNSQPTYSPVELVGSTLISLEHWGGYLFTKTANAGIAGSPVNLGCVVEATGQRCPGFPKMGYTTWLTPGYNTTSAPIVDASGTLTGICGQNGVGSFTCWDLNGTSLGAAPWSNQVPGAYAGYVGFGSPLLIGTRLYVPWNVGLAGTYTCWDYATNSACAGFVQVSSGQDVRPYTIRQDPQNPDCLWVVGDAGRFEVFSATFGGSIGCNVGNSQIVLTPSEFYCDGQPGHVTGWNQLEVHGVPATGYEAIAVTITDADGDPVAGWSNRIVDSADVPVDISSIPYAGSTTTLNVAIVINWGQNTPQPASASATFAGDPVQVCFQTVVGASQCTAPQNIDNAATAVTSVTGGPSDGPSGNSTGTARFVQPAHPELCPADVSIEKSTSEPVVPGEEATYSLRVTNHGPHGATNVVVSDPLPSALSFVSASAGCSEAGGTVTCSLASLGVGQSHTFSVTATVDTAADGCSVLRNTATVGTTTFDPDLSNNTSSICNFERRANRSIAKVVSQSQVPTGGQVMYTLVVRNHGPSDDSNVTATDRMAAGLRLVSATPSQGSCSTDGGRVSCDLGNLRAGGSAQVLVTATVTAGSGCVTNTATVGGDAFDPTPDNNSDSAQVCVGGPPPTAFDLEVDKRASARRVWLGQAVTYRIVVRNNGPGAAPDAKLTDTYNAAATVVSVRTTKGRCTRRLPITCDLGRIEAGGRVTVTAVIRPRDVGRVRNAASATSCCGTDTDPSNNLDRADVRVRRVALRLSKVASQEVVRGGQTFGYRIRVRNPTRGQARNIRVCDRLPSGLRYVSAKPRARVSGRQQCWTIRRLGARKSRTYAVTVRAAPGAVGRKVNTATLTSPDASRRLRARDAVRILGQATPVTG
jgi:uncharacterized repeat protein (TIGR01451 family)